MIENRIFANTPLKRHILVVSLTLLPIASVLLLAFVLFFNPVFRSFESILKQEFHEIRPVNHLQVALLKAVMAPNDYLVNGDPAEFENWQQVRGQVDSIFAKTLKEVHPVEIQSFLEELEQKWQIATQLGNGLFREVVDPDTRKTIGREMKQFDAAVDAIIDDLDVYLQAREDQLRNQYLALYLHKTKSIALVVFGIAIGILSGVLGGFWLTRARKRMVDMAFNDPLTGIYNRRALDDSLKRLTKKRNSWTIIDFSCLLLDIDKFKSINDNYGHDIGDLALKTLGHVLQETIRHNDVYGRYGGEEFLLLLPSTDSSEAFNLAERIRKNVEATVIDLPREQGQIAITVSIGCSTSRDAADTIDELIRQADEAMYMAKESGRNRVALYGEKASQDEL